MIERAAAPIQLQRRSASGDKSLWLAVLIAVLAGIACRLRLYAARASFWADEAFVVLNLIDHSYLRLLHHLDHGQAAPPFFLWIERGLAQSLGVNEFALRLMPLICGVVGLCLFAVLALRLFPEAVAIGAVAMFAFCDKLIAYSAETKQYSGDVMMSVVLLLLATTPGRAPLNRLARCACAAAVSIWFSHTSAIVFGAVSLVLLIECWRAGRREFWWALGWNGLVGISFITLYLTSVRHQNTPWMHVVWKSDFPDFSQPARVPAWLVRKTLELLGGAYPMVAPLLVIAALLGMIDLVRRRRLGFLFMLTGPILLTIFAAFVQKYPFNSSRLTLFLLPQIFLLCAAGFDAVRRALPTNVNLAWWLLPLPIMAVGMVDAGIKFASPKFRSHIRPVVAYVRAHRAAGEAIYLTGQPGNIDPNPTEGRHLEFLCYWRNPDPPLHTLTPASWADVPEKRFWVVFPFQEHRSEQWRKSLLSDLAAVAAEKDHFIEPRGGAAYLFVAKRN